MFIIHKKIGKVYIFIGNLDRNEQFFYHTKNGFVLCGHRKQIMINNFAFYDQVYERFNGKE